MLFGFCSSLQLFMTFNIQALMNFTYAHAYQLCSKFPLPGRSFPNLHTHTFILLNFKQFGFSLFFSSDFKGSSSRASKNNT